MNRPSQQPAPVWVPLHAVALPVLGMQPELVRTAIELGQLPVRQQRFGRRGLVHLNAADLAQYVAAQAQPAGGAR